MFYDPGQRRPPFYGSPFENWKAKAMTKFLITIPLLMFPLSCLAQEMTAAQQDRMLRINQIQVIGSHNSYHTGIAPSERKVIEQKDPKAMRALDYAHAALPDQLTGGVRQVELDVMRILREAAMLIRPSWIKSRRQGCR
jgi:hypothetical protein